MDERQRKMMMKERSQHHMLINYDITGSAISRMREASNSHINVSDNDDDDINPELWQHLGCIVYALPSRSIVNITVYARGDETEQRAWWQCPVSNMTVHADDMRDSGFQDG